jgi:hypothetical protein
MEEDMETAWPSGLPETLWQLDKLQPEKTRDLPMSGIVPETDFALAFLAGALIIAFFAWRRFRERSFEPGTFDYRVITELAPTQLRGRNPMLRAYMLYVGALLFIYIAFTFFGKILFDVSTYVPLSGLQFNAGSVDLKSPTWPLMLAFGFAGAIPLFKPLEMVETWLRRWSHERVGIPVRIRERTARLLRNLRRAEKARDNLDPASEFPGWVRNHLQDEKQLLDMLDVREDLEKFLDWRRNDRDIWPRGEIHDSLRGLEATECAEAATALDDFQDLLLQDYDTLPGTRSDAAPAGRITTLQAHRKRLETNLDSIVERMTRLRGEVAAILAIYAERDTSYREIHDPDLRALLQRTFDTTTSREGPELGIAACLPLVLVLYTACAATGYHPLLSEMQLNPVTVGITALVETARFAAIFLLPMAAVFAWRTFRLQARRWIPMTPRHPDFVFFFRTGAVVLTAAFVSAGALALLSLLWVFLIAENPDRLREVWLDRSPPFLWYLVTQAGIAGIVALVAVMAADDPQDHRFWHGFRLTIYALAGASCTFLMLAIHYALWLSPYYCTTNQDPSLSIRLFSDLFVTEYGSCFNYYSGLDLLLYPTFAALAAGPLLRFTLQPSEAAPGPRPAAPVHVRAHALLVAGLFTGAALLLGPVAARAQDSSAESSGRIPIVVGFRADAEPFSYYIETDSGPQFRGYVADLCYEIFAGSKYEVYAVEVTAQNRFARLRRADDPAFHPSDRITSGSKVDVICDPITMRFNRPDDNRIDGIFSPIIFISGVSYVHRPGEAPGPVQLAYVEGTTAGEVAIHACKVNLFNLPAESYSGVCSEKAVEQARRCDEIPDPWADKSLAQPERRYEICVKKSHTELVKWICQQPEAGMLVPERVYFGDRDIILGKIETWKKENNPCPVKLEKNQPTYTYEPYAIVVAARDLALVQHVQRRVYEFFSHRSAARAHFSAYFPGNGISKPLAMLFLINAVDDEEFYIHADFGSDGKIAAVIPEPDGQEPQPEPAKVEELFNETTEDAAPIPVSDER